jgi:hypothetical protein
VLRVLGRESGLRPLLRQDDALAAREHDNVDRARHVEPPRRRHLLQAALRVSTPVMARKRVFYEGEIVNFDRPSGILSIRGDARANWRFRVDASTRIQKQVKTAGPGTVADLKSGTRVRVFTGSERASPPMRQALQILIYDGR